MKTYKIYVNGMYVGTEDFTRSEVTAIESDQDIKLIEKQNAEAINMIQPKRSDLGASAVGWSPGSDDGRPKKAARLPSTAATNQKRKVTVLYHSQKGKENEKIITQRNLQNGRNDGWHQIRM